MAAEVFFEPENEEFNLYIDNKEVKRAGKFKKIKWKQNQLELFKRFKEIKQNIWIQIYDVYLDKSENVIGLGFRITPEASFYHEYPDIDFDINGFILGDLEEELKDIKASSQKWYKLVNNFYKVLINLQKEQKIIVNNKSKIH
ncbi:hypothetical protein [Spiroplasma endosymbiont of Lariophagus distinguendus]|uniref:hypothetical protein n=1 Tax=Spiroplasma endosymbiont of Lariophagus distinguendus TaxID=2935082 RepID=UPI0020798613|nr:hypothetical protein [Spiroplasma endosymbiont of Lariophagus distinguendus]